jgi:uncharacterized protein (TIGR04255 family)
MAEPKSADATLSKAVLNPPALKRVRYGRNFIKTAVCELRFPTLLELETHAPVAFQKRIRKYYPFYEPQIIDTSDGDQVAREHRYLFRSKDQKWTVAVKSFAVAIETSKYIDFEDFFERFRLIFSNARSVIDADFFTRIGLRYINSIPLDDGNLEGWIRPELVAPLTTGVLGEVTRFGSVIQGEMEGGRYVMRHGMRSTGGDKPSSSEESTTRAETDVLAKKAKQEGSKAPTSVARNYELDFDYYAENVEIESVESCIKRFNETNFLLFHWCLGEKAKKLLGEGKAKR